jgi:hypothetical protein
VVGTTAVVVLARGAVVSDGDEVEVVVGLLLPDPQPVTTSPAIRALAARTARVFTLKTI